MGFLRLLLRIPFYILSIIWEACLYFALFLLVLLRIILWAISPIIGDVNWSTPKWYPNVKQHYQSLSAALAKRKTLIGSTIIIVIIAYFSGNYLYHWYLNRPKSIDFAPTIINTYHANYDKPYYSNSTLDISFSGNSRSPAPLELIGKPITEGISISPNIDGVWRWSSDSIIEFKPTHTWPLGVKYTVKLNDEKLFANDNKLQDNSNSYTFATQEFSYSINDKQLYQDPINTKNRMAIFTINFSHPVNKVSFENKISLELINKRSSFFIKSYDYTISYDDNLTTAYIKSSQLDLPEEDCDLKLKIDKGIMASMGSNLTSMASYDSLFVPSKYNLNINNSDISLVEINNQKIQQVLTISFNYNVNASDLNKILKVWQLPINRNKKYREDYYSVFSKKNKTRFNVDQNDLANAQLLPLKAIDTEQNYQNQISFEFKADQGKELYIEVKQPLVSDGGYYLSKEYLDVKTVPMYPAVMNFATSGSLLSLSGDKKIPVVSRNMSKLKLDIERVIPSQLQHLVSFNQNDFQWMDFGDLDSDNFVEKYSVTKSINGAAESINYSDVDLSQYLKKDLNGNEIRGVFLVRLYGNHQENEKESFDYYTSRFIIVTDIGIINKKSLDQSQDIFIQSIRSGEPIKNAKVSVLGVNGIEITSQQTDDNGHAHFAPLSDYYQGIKPLYFVVEKGQDLSFLPISSYDRQLNFSRFDVGGIYETVDGGELRTHLFSDRGVYRPGDTFHIGMIVRAQDWSKSLDGIQLEADIYDPKSNRVKTQSIVLDEYGFKELAYKTNYSSPTGEWYINLYLKNPKEDYRTLLGSTSVVIREFEPDKTAVSLTLLPEIKEGWVHPDALSAKVDAKNLFGTPAQNRVVKSQLYLEPSAPYFKKYDNYAFYQNISRNQNSFNIAIEETLTDENGIASLALPITSFDGNYTAKLLTEVFEPDSGRSVSATSTIFVSPNDYLVGAKADGRLDYIKKDSTRIINFIAIAPNLEQISLTDLTLVKLEQKYLSVLVKQPSGVYKYESKRKDTVLSQMPFAIDKTSTNYAISDELPGNYLLQIKNKSGYLIYQTAYSVAGTANITRNLDRNAELELKISNNQYKAGDEIEVSITAPYVGSGIITIERDKVYAWQWFKTTTTSSVQKITVPEGIEGNAYINVQFIRDPSSDEIFMSPLSYAVTPFKISNDKFNDHIKLTAPDKIKPGEILPITLQTNSKQRVIIFAIDEGILQVADYKLKNPLNEFIRKKALSVKTLQILDLILPDYNRLLNLSAPGGDMYELKDELSGHLNPFKRKVDNPVTYWSGIIDVDGVKTVDYFVPDYFNGKIRIMAVSVGKETMGSTQTTTTVRNDFVLTPNIPYFVAPNDEFEISLSVANNLEDTSDKAIPITVTLNTTPQLTLIDEATKTIDLSPMKEGTLKFKLKATDNLGSGDLHFTASYHDKVVKRNVSTSVRPASQYRLKTVMGRMDGSKQSFTDIRDMYAPFSERDASVSYSPLILSRGLATYLANYPHLCSEQILSQAMPLLLNSKYPDFELVKNNSIKLDSLFQMLQTRQNSEGAIGLWYSSYNVDPFITLYAVNFMLEAKEADQLIPNKMLENANKYIKQIASSTRTDQYGLRLRAYAIYLLTRQNQVTTSYLASIVADLNDNRSKGWQTDLTALYLASSYQMLKMDREANQLLKPVWQELANAYDNAWWNHNYYDPLVLEAGKIYLIAKHFPKQAKDIPPQALENLVLMLNQERYTTQSSAMTLLALDSYVSSINKDKLAADDLTITSESKVDEQNKYQTIAKLKGLLAKGSFTADARTVSFNNQTHLPAWYLMSQQGFDKTIQTQPITKGLEVYREFTDEKGNIVNQVTLGDKINVTVRIRTLSKEGATNIAIVDLLPGGFEVVQQPISSTKDNYQENDEYDGEDEENYQSDEGYHWISPIAVGNYTWYPDYTDVREDRVIIYGSTANNKTQTFTYQIKATNIGQYIVPSAYGEAMYDRDIQAVSKGGDLISVIAK
ncbi:MG2 domain-containing protein [Orbus wheelerorum]|uniref:alpha-2-macroglobulin n=1 Tax=Orbus wheelerorum TaxID=3074111 RepID=UPI00370DA897